MDGSLVYRLYIYVYKCFCLPKNKESACFLQAFDLCISLFLRLWLEIGLELLLLFSCFLASCILLSPVCLFQQSPRVFPHYQSVSQEEKWCVKKCVARADKQKKSYTESASTTIFTLHKYLYFILSWWNSQEEKLLLLFCRLVLLKKISCVFLSSSPFVCVKSELKKMKKSFFSAIKKDDVFFVFVCYCCLLGGM